MGTLFQTLMESDLFQGFSELEVLELLSGVHYHVRQYEANEVIASDSAPHTAPQEYIYLILQGRVTHMLNYATDYEHHLRWLREGKTFGEVVLFSQVEHMPYTYRALTPTTLLLLPKSFLQSQGKDYRGLYGRLLLNFLRILEEMCLFLFQKIYCLNAQKVEDRLIRYLTAVSRNGTRSTFQISYNRTELANYLGVSREALSRELSKLRQANLLQLDMENHVSIPDYGALISLSRNHLISVYEEKCEEPLEQGVLPQGSEELRQIADSSLFRGIEPWRVGWILHKTGAKVTKCRKGQFLYRNGNRSNTLYLILEGEISLLLELDERHHHIVYQLHPDDLAGVTPFLQEGPQFACRALTDCKVLMVEKQALYGVCGEDFAHYCKIIQNLVAIITQKIVLQRNKVYYLCTASSEMRLKKYLLDCASLQKSKKVHIPYTREELASYLGISRPVLSKDFAKLKRQGVIDLEKEWITLLDLDALWDN